MRHRNSNKKLNRKSSHRLAMFRNMSNSLIIHESIVTTLPKAKELRRIVEPLVTIAKNNSVANMRLVFNRTRNREVVEKLFNDLSIRNSKRNGGYLRVLKYGFRDGDNAPLAYVEFVEKLSNDESNKKDNKKSLPVKEPKKEVKQTKAKKTVEQEVKKDATQKEVKKSATEKSSDIRSKVEKNNNYEK